MYGKYKRGLVQEVKKEQAFNQKQSELKEKYNIENSDVVVVEKTNMLKFTINKVFLLVRWGITAVVSGLAVVGVLTLVYPQIRLPFFYVANQIYRQILDFIGL